MAATPQEGLGEIHGIAATHLSALAATLHELVAPDCDRRDQLAIELRFQWQRRSRDAEPTQRLPENAVEILATLLDELATARPDEPLGRLATDLRAR